MRHRALECFLEVKAWDIHVLAAPQRDGPHFRKEFLRIPGGGFERWFHVVWRAALEHVDGVHW